MCGLVGVAGDINHKVRSAFQDMLVMDVLRGPHSTGIATVDPQAATSIAKAAMLPTDLMQTKAYKDALFGSLVLMMGHNRFATTGKVNTPNAHPFEHGDVIGMHNGTLKNWVNTLEGHKDFDVDSDCLIHNLSYRDHKVLFEKLEGAFAVTWYDQADHKFYMIRNKERPLVTWLTKDAKTLFYASESWMIAGAADRRGVELANQPMDLPIGKLLSFELPEKANAGLGKPLARGFKMYEPPKACSYDYYNQYGSNVRSLPPAHSKFSSRVGTRVSFRANSATPPGTDKDLHQVRGVTSTHPALNVVIRCNEAEKDLLMQTNAVLTGVPQSFMAPYTRKNAPDEPGYLVIPYSSVAFIKDAPVQKVVENEDDTSEDISEEISEEITDAEYGLMNAMDVVGPNGNILSERQFKELTKHGCGLCQCDLEYRVDEVMWVDKDPLCDECYDEYYENTAHNANAGIIH